MEPSPEARRLAIDIQEHPEWSYMEIAARIDALLGQGVGRRGVIPDDWCKYQKVKEY
jgi:hypothetical protein